jgi:CRP/FNR family transcriptional regulator, cyclic AMP receptor protein
MTALPEGNRSSLLSSVPVFASLAADQIDTLAHRLVRRSCTAGETIFLRGDAGSSLAILVAGRVALRLTSAQGREITLAILEPGEMFGELSLLDGKARSTDAIAFEACEMLILHRRDVLPFLQDSPSACMAMLDMLSDRLRRTSEQLEAVALFPLSTRLARLLLAMGRMEGADRSPKGILLPAVFSQRDLGQLIGASREKVNQQLRQWIALNILTQSAGRLLIREPETLADMAEADYA